MRYSPFLSCREAARLITARLDRDLTPFERIGLHWHLKICDACPIVIRQLAILRRAMVEWREASEHGPGAVARMGDNADESSGQGNP